MKDHMKDKKLLKVGIIGTAVAALCCFTPLLVVLLGVVGLSAMLGWLDYVLFPALGFFLALTAYALHRRRRNGGAAACAAIPRPGARPSAHTGVTADRSK